MNTKIKKILVKRMNDDCVIASYNVSSKSKRQIEKLYNSLINKINTEKYYLEEI